MTYIYSSPSQTSNVKIYEGDPRLHASARPRVGDKTFLVKRQLLPCHQVFPRGGKQPRGERQLHYRFINIKIIVSQFQEPVPVEARPPPAFGTHFISSQKTFIHMSQTFDRRRRHRRSVTVVPARFRMPTSSQKTVWWGGESHPTWRQTTIRKQELFIETGLFIFILKNKNSEQC